MTEELPKTLPAFFWHFARPYKWPMLVFLLSPCALIIESTLLPYATKLIVDTITTYEGDRSNIFAELSPALWLLGGGWILMTTIFRLQEWWQCYVHPKFEADIRMAMFDYVLGHSHHYFANNFAGSISNKISDMVNSIRSIWMFIRWPFVATMASMLSALTVMAFVHVPAAMALGVWIIIHMGIGYYFARKTDAAALVNAEDRSTLSGKVVDAFTNASNVRLFASHAYEKQYLGNHQDTEKRSNYRMLLMSSNAKIATEIPSWIALATILYVTVLGWQHSILTSGDFVFIFYASWNVFWHTWNLSMELPNFFRDLGIAKQALSVITPPHGIADMPDAKPLQVNKGEISFEDVHFHYVPGKDIFKDKNITIKAGEKVGLVGFSGSGKSTFVNLILRFYDVESGDIRIDGQNISEVTKDSLRQNIAMIPQDTSLFHRTLMENIRYGQLNASDEEVLEASKKAHCHEFIQDIPEQYDALVGERGVKLSGGQRQRIAVARAILKNAPILILDEATSSLDSLTEKYIQASLKQLMESRTTIVIAHRLSTLSDMDRILVFKEGEIIEDGTHQALLAANGHYAKLWNMQVGGFLPDEE